MLAIGLGTAEWGHYHWLSLSYRKVRPWPASRPKQALKQLQRQPCEASGPYVESYIPSQTHFPSNLAQFTEILGPEITDTLGTCLGRLA